MSRVKKVKFTHTEPTQGPRAYASAPKTSEYAFFKRLKKDIDGINYRQLYKVDNQLKTTNASSHAETSTNFSTFKYMDGNLTSSSRAERRGPTNEFSLLTPIGFESDKSGAGNNKDIFSEINQKTALFSGYITHVGGNVFPSPFAGAAKGLGNQYAEEGIFSAKRQKLRQLVAETFPEVGEFSSKGFDLVSALVSRLFPRGNETELYQYSNSKVGIVDSQYQSPDFPEPDPLEKTSTHNASKFQDGSYGDMAFPEYWSSTPREEVLSKWDTVASDLPLTQYDAETVFHDEEPICGFDGETIRSLCRDRDSSCCTLFEKCRFSPDHLKELDEIYDPCELAIKEPRTLLLSWDDNEEREKNLYSTLATLSDVADQPIMDDFLEVTNMCSSSFCSNHDLDFNSSYSHSTYALMHDIGRSHEDDYAVAEADQFQLGLSLPQKYLTRGEDCDTCNQLEKNAINLISIDNPWYSSKVSGSIKGDFEALLFSTGKDGNAY